MVMDRDVFVARVKELYARVEETSRDEIPLKDGRILLVERGKEPLKGMPLNEETVRGYLKDPTITEAARLCIGLTWEHRAKLGLPG